MVFCISYEKHVLVSPDVSNFYGIKENPGVKNLRMKWKIFHARKFVRVYVLKSVLLPAVCVFLPYAFSFRGNGQQSV